jgi:Flp pilus assembly protein TadG
MAVEFAIIAPVFLFLVLGVIQFASIMFMQNNMLNAAREAARQVAVGAQTPTQAQTTAQNLLAGWPLTFNILVVEGGTPINVTATISTPMDRAGIIDMIGLTGRTLRAQVVMRKET